jgi:hypothetical protein
MQRSYACSGRVSREMFGVTMFGITRYVVPSGLLDVAPQKPLKFAFSGLTRSIPWVMARFAMYPCD